MFKLNWQQQCWNCPPSSQMFLQWNNKDGRITGWSMVTLMNLISRGCRSPGRGQGHKNSIEGRVEGAHCVQKQSNLHFRCQQYLAWHFSGRNKSYFKLYWHAQSQPCLPWIDPSSEQHYHSSSYRQVKAVYGPRTAHRQQKDFSLLVSALSKILMIQDLSYTQKGGDWVNKSWFTNKSW